MLAKYVSEMVQLPEEVAGFGHLEMLLVVLLKLQSTNVNIVVKVVKSETTRKKL